MQRLEHTGLDQVTEEVATHFFEKALLLGNLARARAITEAYSKKFGSPFEGFLFRSFKRMAMEKRKLDPTFKLLPYLKLLLSDVDPKELGEAGRYLVLERIIPIGDIELVRAMWDEGFKVDEDDLDSLIKDERLEKSEAKFRFGPKISRKQTRGANRERSEYAQELRALIHHQ